MLLEWLRRHLNILMPLALFLASLLTLSINTYKRQKSSFFTRTVFSLTGYGQNAVSGTTGGLSSLWDKYIYLVGVEKENQELKAELQKLKRENYALRDQEMENDRLRRMTNLEPRKDIRRWIPAQVIGRPLSSLNKTIVINKGSRHDIKPRMAVITYDNMLVGQILDEPGSIIGYHQSQVLLITDRRSRVPVVVERSRATGILAGRPETDDCELLYLSESKIDDIRVGDLLVSSGYGGVFLKGWPAGKAIETIRDPALLYPQVTVRPAADFNKIEEVLVIVPVEDSW